MLWPDRDVTGSTRAAIPLSGNITTLGKLFTNTTARRCDAPVWVLCL